MAMDVGSSGIPLEHQKFDEAHDLSESDELESSIETNPSPVKRQSKQDARGDSPPHFDFNDSPPRQDCMDDSDSTDSDDEGLSRRLGLDATQITPVKSQPAATTAASAAAVESESESESGSGLESDSDGSDDESKAQHGGGAVHTAAGQQGLQPAPAEAAAAGGLGAGGAVAGASPPKDPNEYDPVAYAHCGAGDPGLRDLFRHIGAYQPQDIAFAATLRPFVPDYLPATGQPDCFLKVRRSCASQNAARILLPAV